MNWTDEQADAILARGENLLLAAAAGSGKTTVLVERVLSLIVEGANIDDMLIVTFSRAAAADMRKKLTARLSSSAADSEHLRTQLDRLENASISTIHSFCAELIRTHFEAADVDPTFRVMDGGAELMLMQRQALLEAMEQRYALGGEDLDLLTSGRNAEDVEEMALSLYAFAMERADPWDFLDQSHRRLLGDGREWTDALRASVRRDLLGALAFYEEAMRVCQEPDGPKHYFPAIELDASALATICLLEMDYEEMRLAIEEYKQTNLTPYRPAKGWEKNEEREKKIANVKGLRESASKIIKKKKTLFMPLEAALDDLKASSGALLALIEIVKNMDLILEERKADRAALGFSDLERRALMALSDDNVRSAMRARYAHVFVDEYQDVSDVQEAIIQRIRREDNLFMVGDVKQSIYRFRQAEPSLFIDKYHMYGERRGGRLIALRRNFRSRAAILEFANAVFERVMVGGEAEIEYDELARLWPGAAFEGDDPPVEMHLIHASGRPEEEDEVTETNDEDASDENEEELNAAEREGAIIIRRIRDLIGQPFFDPKTKTTRALRYADFVVLTRKNRAMPYLESMLKDAGIPAYADVSGRYFEVLEVRVALSLLRVIDNRRLDIDLLAVLRSPIVGLSSAQLARIRASTPEGSYRDAMKEAMRKKGAVSDKLLAFESQLSRLRMLARVLPVAHFVELALRETGYYAYVGGLPGGRQRQANLDMLTTLAGDYESTEAGGFAGFLGHISDIKDVNDAFGAAHALGEGDDVVRIMTVHKSKGLEFPVVFAVMMGLSLAGPTNAKPIVSHRSMGVGMVYHDPALGTARDTIAHRAIREQKRLEDLNEEMRILYVLLTRPIDRLILIGSVKNLRACEQFWSIAAHSRISPNTYLDVLMPVIRAMDESRARVTTYPMDSLSRASATSSREGLEELIAQMDAWLENPKRSVDHPVGWTYPYASEVLLPLKLTASGLTRELTGPEALPALTRRPRFLMEGNASAAECGSLTHAALQAIALDSLKGLEGAGLNGAVREELLRMRSQGLLFAPVESHLLTRFFESETGRRMLSADRVEREWAFNLRMSAREALGIDSDAKMLVQGVVDCCFLEDGAWVLLDYKTDRADDEAELLMRYRPQIALYAVALSRITGVPVKEKRIVLLRAGRDILLT